MVLPPSSLLLTLEKKAGKDFPIMRRRFFVERFDGDTATIHGETAEHLGKVLRAEAGQLYELSDGSQDDSGAIADLDCKIRSV